MNNLPPLLQVRAVSYVQQGKILLSPVSFSLQPGEFLWLTGASGAGKSTLLKMVASLLEPTSGSICFHGQPLSQVGPEAYRQRVSYVFQTPQLFGETVYDNLALAWQIRSLQPDRQIMRDWLEKVSLSADLLEQPVGKLSGGEKQRVGLLRSVQFPAEILLLDEITSALDETSKRNVEQLIDRLVGQGTAAIWVSHDRHQISRGQPVLNLQSAEGSAHVDAT